MRLFAKKVSSSKDFRDFMRKHFSRIPLKLKSKLKKTKSMKFTVIYETIDTREEVIVKDYNDLVNKIKIININNWTLISVKRKL